MLEAEDKSVPWQRVLWLKQPQYPDNYLDDSFLENLQRNGMQISWIDTSTCLTVFARQSTSGNTPTSACLGTLFPLRSTSAQ